MKAIYIGANTDLYWTNGKTYNIQTQNMTGKRYKSLDDQEGEKDTRIMLWSSEPNNANLRVYDSDEAIKNDFQMM